eukprot:scaffold2851_cov114-Isochrysis_galbana.AAC.5
MARMYTRGYAQRARSKKNTSMYTMRMTPRYPPTLAMRCRYTAKKHKSFVSHAHTTRSAPR